MYLIAYDIENDRTRNKAAERLLAAGCLRLQLSVFCGDLSDADLKNIRHWLDNNIDKAPNSEDKVFILDLGPEQLRSTVWIGKKPKDWNFLTDPPDVLII